MLDKKTNRLKDSFEITYALRKYYSSNYVQYLTFSTIPEITCSKAHLLACENVYKTAQAWHSRIYKVSLNPSGSTQVNQYYGDDYCNSSNKKCIKDLKVAEFDGICNICTNDTAKFNINVWLWARGFN